MDVQPTCPSLATRPFRVAVLPEVLVWNTAHRRRGWSSPQRRDALTSEGNKKVIEEFRTNDGKVGGWFADKSVLILHTTGARSGKERLAPLVYRQEGDRVFIFASKGGSDSHPDWYHNLKANPTVTVELGTETLDAAATEIVGEERDAIYTRQATAIDNFAAYQAGTDRTIPVIELVVA